MSRLSAGTICWVQDPTKTHPIRPVIILSHDTHPFGASDCTVLCLGTSAGKYNQTTPTLKSNHYTGISFSGTTYVMPWALYTIPPSSIIRGKPMGSLTKDGRTLVKKALISLLP
ncbi:type II toxin-antitoxin system PemK/MazF family toxin [Haladaptatus sp. YSMS36]|uniref:type II toxin-antitoxin system PemK/MazF family toxin n=1 Tax=Haladaptatus sp. YSMS36 TaxID=3033384 RepID=UPI0023E8E5AB|nr:type II toxin-antitoxin system PemK/MazF family toxin [Haladaptatus sp. YSMS36]